MGFFVNTMRGLALLFTYSYNKPMKTIYISYARGGESEAMADYVEKELKKHGYKTVRDKTDLDYRGDIERFEHRLGQGDYIVTIISDRFLKSEHCMTEMLFIERKENVEKRIFPIVMKDAVRIFIPEERQDYFDYWSNKESDLESKLKNKKLGGMGPAISDLDKLIQIRIKIHKITAILANMNTLTENKPRETIVAEIIDAIRKEESDNLERKETKRKEPEKKRNEDKGKTETLQEEISIPNIPKKKKIEIPDDFVHVEGGTFKMGSPTNEPGRYDNEVQHKVRLSSFFIRRYQVTQAQWQAVMGSNPLGFKGDNRPVENVNCYDAVKYCNAISQKEGRTPAYRINGSNVTWEKNANGYRLPTEAEWEYAARGGNCSLGYLYSGSNNVDSVAWYGDNSEGETHQVGIREANELGLYDMSGNVWEWCWDWYGDYPAGSPTDLTGPSKGSSRVLRGGSWFSYSRNVRVAGRGSCSPGNSIYGIGFRPVLPAVE